MDRICNILHHKQKLGSETLAVSEDLEVLQGMFHNLQYRVVLEILFREVQKEVEAEDKLLCTLSGIP